ncbi:MAG: MaoC family dehydratase [Promethearchaeota archaeon]
MPYDEKKWDEVKVGDKEVFTKTISEADDYMFAGITGDFNPMHVDEEYAKKTQFGGRICHGILSAGLISTVLGMKLPGPGCIYGGQTVRFELPIHHGDTVSAHAEVIEKYTKKEGKLKFLKINTTVVIDNCTKDPSQNGKEATTGEATVLMLK